MAAAILLARWRRLPVLDRESLARDLDATIDPTI
jgi:hypothetical protein